MFIFSQKLQILKNHLKVWNKDVFGELHQLVHTSTNNLVKTLNESNMHGMTDMLKDQESKAQQELELALAKEDLF